MHSFTQSRLILLDSPLVIFTAVTALAWTSFMNQHELGPSKAFQPPWWFWLASTGCWVGCDRQRQVGRPLHHRMGWQPYPTTTLGPAWRYQECDGLDYGSSISSPACSVWSLSLYPSTWPCLEFISFASSTLAKAMASCPPNSKQL